MTQLAPAEEFSLTQRKANALAASNIVPTSYQGNVANCLLALDMSERLGVQPLMVMQNLHVIKGKPTWSSSFLIAVLNKSKLFSPLRFRAKKDASGAEIAWRAVANDGTTGETLEGPAVTLEMAKAEGWFSKDGSKWKTMPELMGRYRAAAMFSRLYAPELLMGFLSTDEVEDITKEPRNVTPEGSAPKHIGDILAGLMPESALEPMENLPSDNLTQTEQTT